MSSSASNRHFPSFETDYVKHLVDWMIRTYSKCGTRNRAGFMEDLVRDEWKEFGYVEYRKGVKKNGNGKKQTCEKELDSGGDQSSP